MKKRHIKKRNIIGTFKKFGIFESNLLYFHKVHDVLKLENYRSPERCNENLCTMLCASKDNDKDKDCKHIRLYPPRYARYIDIVSANELVGSVGSSFQLYAPYRALDKCMHHATFFSLF